MSKPTQYKAEAFVDRYLKQAQPNLNRLRRVQRLCKREGIPYVALTLKNKP